MPSSPLKAQWTERFGPQKYKLIFSVVSAIGLGLIVYGFSLTEFVPLFDPMPWGRELVIYTMPIAITLLVASDMPNNIKRLVRHPMLIGLMLWGGTHLLANGDLASTILFASFAVFAFLDVILVARGGRYKAKEAVSVRWDVAVLGIGLVGYCVAFYFHEFFSGVPLM